MSVSVCALALSDSTAIAQNAATKAEIVFFIFDFVSLVLLVRKFNVLIYSKLLVLLAASVQQAKVGSA